MKNYNELLRKYQLKPISYLKKGQCLIIDTKDKKYVIKEKNDNFQIYSYLKSRSANFFPNIIIDDDNYEITEYLEEISIPEEQKLEELMRLLALLHSKTTYQEEINLAHNKEIYEDLKNNIEYLKSYYEDIIALIETKEIMSPSEYLFARNFTIIMDSLNYASNKLENWYKNIENMTTTRIVILHNNLSLDHFIYGKTKSFLSWRKAKFGSPIFDLFTIFKKYGNKYDFKSKLQIYETIYPLTKEELELLYIFMILPPKIEFKGTEYDLCDILTQKIELLYRSYKIVLPDNLKNRKENDQNKN